jgi:sialate O-acetylesterase
MKRLRGPSLLTTLAVFLATRLALAEVKLPAVIGDHMVLQRDRPIPVWGWDDAGSEVTVEMAGAKASGKADEGGRWMVKLPPMAAGGPFTMAVAGTSKVTISDVLVGEVWLCSGQSNMEWTVGGAENPQAEIAASNHMSIRHIKVNRVPAAEPRTEVPSGGWQVSSPATAGGFTAVGYFFGKMLHKELDVAVGLIGSNWGGTRIEPWTPPVGFQKVPALKDIADKLGEFPSKNEKGEVNHQSPLALYNGMIHPLLPYAIRGAIWYQGESNNGEGMLYHEKMKALIEGWRAVWENPELPFYYVQLAPFRYGGDPTSLPRIWEAQLATLSVPRTGMAVTVDIGNVGDIHPRNKQAVGKRLALWALAKDYGREGLVHSGPIYKSMRVEGDKIRIAFDHVGRGLTSRDGKPLGWFAIAGEDKGFVEAAATIDGDTVVVSSEKVPAPVAVRFGWHQEAEPNLSNVEGLPASPFRTDSW